MTSNQKVNKIIFKFILVLIIFVLQSVANNLIKINNVVPDLFFVCIMFYACIEKDIQKVIIAALTLGVISDVICHSSFVGYTAVYTYCAAGGYYLKNLFMKPNVVFLSVIMLILFMVGEMTVYPVFLVTAKVGFGDYMARDVIPVAFYNTVCFFVIYIVTAIVLKRGENRNASEF